MTIQLNGKDDIKFLVYSYQLVLMKNSYNMKLKDLLLRV